MPSQGLRDDWKKERRRKERASSPMYSLDCVYKINSYTTKQHFRTRLQGYTSLMSDVIDTWSVQGCLQVLIYVLYLTALSLSICQNATHSLAIANFKLTFSFVALPS